MMIKCRICGAEFAEISSLRSHVSILFGRQNKIHIYPWYVYLAKHENQTDLDKENLQKMYFDQKKSTPMIAEELGITKKALIDAMHWYGIPLRGLSEAAKNQIERDGIWNKGQTKYTHPSVKKYADSRIGSNNPFIKAPGYELRRAKSAEIFAKYRNSGIGNHTPKSTEKRMKALLEKEHFQFVPQFYIKYKDTWRWYDFLIEGMLIVEMQGNYYHANPSMYQSDSIIVIAKEKRLAKDIWEYDKEKKQLATDSGYKFLDIWEKEFVGMSNEQIAQLLRDSIK